MVALSRSAEMIVLRNWTLHSKYYPTFKNQNINAFGNLTARLAKTGKGILYANLRLRCIPVVERSKLILNSCQHLIGVGQCRKRVPQTPLALMAQSNGKEYIFRRESRDCILDHSPCSRIIEEFANGMVHG